MAFETQQPYDPSTRVNPLHVNGDEFDALLEENGGTGEWETGSDSASIERWSFPRYPGADDVDEDGNLIDASGMYLSRSGLGPFDTDVETVEAWLNAPRAMVGAILALGEPGSGKTALAQAAVTRAERTPFILTATPDHTLDSLFLRFVGEGKGDLLHSECEGHDHKKKHRDSAHGGEACPRSPYTLGPVPYAVKHGLVLIVDEFMLFVDGIKSLFYPLMDGNHWLPQGNIDGSQMAVHPDFRIILTSNPTVRGASLPEPIASRCAGTTITVETSAEMLRDLGIDDSIVSAWEALGAQKLWRPQIREMRVADYWLDQNPAQALSAFLPEHAPESQRTEIHNTVIGFLGTGGFSTRDGRLVVS